MSDKMVSACDAPNQWVLRRQVVSAAQVLSILSVQATVLVPCQCVYLRGVYQMVSACGAPNPAGAALSVGAAQVLSILSVHATVYSFLDPCHLPPVRILSLCIEWSVRAAHSNRGAAQWRDR